MKIFVLMIVIVLSGCDGYSEQQRPSLTTNVVVSIITKDNVIRVNQIPATVLAEERASLSFQLSGTINKVLIKIGETVTKDQALMSLYNPNIDPTLESNFAKLESIKAQILQARRDVASLKELRKNNSTSKNAYERNKTVLKDLIAQEKAINAQINLALANQSESIVKAPFDGSITTVSKQVGEFVAAGQVVISIFAQDKQEVEIYLTHALWKNLKLGDVISGSYQDKAIELSITELSQSADAQSHLMKVILALTEPLKNGIGQQVIINIPETFKDVYLLPLEVVVDDGINEPYIFTAVDDQAVKQYINPLFIKEGNIVFNSEIDINDRVVIKGQSKISQGMKLQVNQ